MGKLTNLNPSAPIADADLPPSIARDSETDAAIAAHLNAVDPHLQYPTQARADERYGAIKKIVYTGNTGIIQGAVVGFLHNLDVFRILSISAVIQYSTSGDLVTANHTFSPGYECSLSCSDSVIYITNVSTKSANILNKPFRVVVDYAI